MPILRDHLTLSLIIPQQSLYTERSNECLQHKISTVPRLVIQ